MKTYELKKGDIVRVNDDCSYEFLGMDGAYGKWCEVGDEEQEVFIGNYDDIQVGENGKYYIN